MSFIQGVQDVEVAKIIQGMPREYGNGMKVNLTAFLGRLEFEMNKTLCLQLFYCEVLSRMRIRKL